MGYHRAGFEVVGVDTENQPEYPFAFVRADALEVDLAGFDAIHASPPCQAFTHARHLGRRGRTDHPRLIDATRARLREAGVPYVIENVQEARGELRAPFMLCGSAFGLDVQRHRLFETNVPLLVPSCQHGVWHDGRRHPGTPRADGSRPGSRVVNAMASGCTHQALADAMGIDWMRARGTRPTRRLREAIPPAYTEFIGVALLAAVAGRPATHGEVGTGRPAGRLP